MRWLGAIALTVLVIVGVLTVLGQGPSVASLGLDAPPEQQASASYAAENARLVQTDDSGAPLYVLEARELHQQTGSGDIQASELRLNYVPPDAGDRASPWTLTAREGLLPGDTLQSQRQIRLTGNVRLSGQPAGAREPLRVETSALDFDIDGQIARTRESVRFYWGSRRLTARGLNADLKQGTLRLESSVHGRFPP